jgi:hypothetical protein
VDDRYTLSGRLDDQTVVLDLGCGRGGFHYEACRGRIVAMDPTLPAEAARRPPRPTCLQTRVAFPCPMED